MKMTIFLACLLIQLVKYVYSADTVEDVNPEYLDDLLQTGNYKEFSRLLQLGDPILVRPLQGNESVETVGEYLINNNRFADVFLRDSQTEEAIQGQNNLTRYPVSKWNNRIVPYYLSQTSYEPDEYERITKAIQYWNDRIPQIQFRPTIGGEKNYVMIFNGNACFSNLGKVGGQQALSIQTDDYCWTEGWMHHEMMHTVGRLHEISRPDRDDYIKMLYKNIDENWQHLYDKADFDLHAPYDYYSIMHFQIPAFPELDPERPAYVVLEDDVDTDRIGDLNVIDLSSTDLESIANMYS